MHIFIEKRYGWDTENTIFLEVRTELLFWQSNLRQSNGIKIKQSPQVNKIFYSDAIAEKVTAVISYRNLAKTIARGDFCASEIPTSSTFRELLAVKYILHAFKKHLKNQCVQWFSDNMNVSRIINSGSTTAHLQTLAIEIYNACIINNIILFPAWVPRGQNKFSDHISKEVDTDNWGIDNETFEHIQNNYGEFEVDRFADDINKKVNNFNSKYHCPNSTAVNAFTCDWKDKFNWLCPPVYLIGKTLRYLELCREKGVLFFPIWKSAYYWPMITNDGHTFKPFIKHYLLLDPYFIYHANRFFSVFQGFAKFYSMALLIDFA